MSIRNILEHVQNEKPSKLMEAFNSVILEKINTQIDSIRLDVIAETFGNDDDDDEDVDEDVDENTECDCEDEDCDCDDVDENVAGKKRTASQRVAASREKKKKTAKKIKKNKKLKRIRKTSKFKTQVKKREKKNVGKKARTARRREAEKQ